MQKKIVLSSIKTREGKNFAKLSGDHNKIHTDDLVGYNSLFGEKICHGVLILIKIITHKKLKKYFQNLNDQKITINFQKHFLYNKKIYLHIKKEKIKEILIYQDSQVAAILKVEKNENKFKFLKNSKNFYFNFNNKLLKYHKESKQTKSLITLLCTLSKYVGTINPGRNSIIGSISISMSKNFVSDRKIKIISKKIDPRLPLINNKLIYKDFIIEFSSYLRPTLKIKYNKLDNAIINRVKKEKNNILILGASSGIGMDVLNIFLKNNKIKVIGTFYRNKIKIKSKNLIKYRINILKDQRKIKKIINKYRPSIYYFATPKILFESKNKYLDHIYKKYFIDAPIKIFRIINNKTNFFYPSSTYNNKSSSYSLIKRKAENTFKKLRLSKVKLNILRIDIVNTKNNLSIFNTKNPNFRDLLFQNKNYFNKFFFK